MPATTARQVYAETVRGLPLDERLRLAALILEDLAQPSISLVEASDTWTEQDQLDVTAFSLQYAAAHDPWRERD